MAGWPLLFHHALEEPPSNRQCPHKNGLAEAHKVGHRSSRGTELDRRSKEGGSRWAGLWLGRVRERRRRVGGLGVQDGGTGVARGLLLHVKCWRGFLRVVLSPPPNAEGHGRGFAVGAGGRPVDVRGGNSGDCVLGESARQHDTWNGADIHDVFGRRG